MSPTITYVTDVQTLKKDFRRRILRACAALVLGALVGLAMIVLRLVFVFGDVGSTSDPAIKTKVLSEGIASAMSVGFAGFAAVVVVLMGYIFLSYRNYRTKKAAIEPENVF